MTFASAPAALGKVLSVSMRSSRWTPSFEAEIRLRYLDLFEGRNYVRKTSARNRKAILKQFEVPSDEAPYMFTVKDLLGQAERLRTGEASRFRELHRISSLITSVQYLLHSPTALQRVREDTLMSGMLQLSAVLHIGCEDKLLFSLLDHLVLLLERRNMSLSSLNGALLRECNLRAQLFWNLEKTMTVFDSFLRLAVDPATLTSMAQTIGSKLYQLTEQKAIALETTTVFLLCYHLLYLKENQVIDKLALILERKIRRKVWTLPPRELLLPVLFWHRHGHSIQDKHLNDVLNNLVSRTPNLDPLFVELVKEITLPN